MAPVTGNLLVMRSSLFQQGFFSTSARIAHIIALPVSEGPPTMLNQPAGIDRSLLLAQLITTERHISATARTVVRQQSIIQELQRRGDDASYAESLLHHLQEMQAMRMADRDRMRAALGDSDPTDRVQDSLEELHRTLDELGDE